MVSKTPKNAVAKKARRKAIAKGMIEQKTPSAIAEELGVSRKTVWQELQHPETQDYIQKLLAPRDKEIEELLDQSIAAVRSGLVALKGDEADHGVRMRAVERTTKLLELRAGKREDGGGDKSLRWQGEFVELLALYAKFPTTPEA